MPEEQVESGAAELIQQYRKAAKSRSTSRMALAIFAFVIVGCFLWIIWGTFRDFQVNGIPAVQAKLADEMGIFAPIVGEQISDAAARVIPVYSECLARTFERDQDKYLQVLVDEYTKLMQFAEDRSPKVEEAIAALVSDQERVANEAIRQILSEDDFARLSLAYQDSLIKNLTRVMETHFSEHVVVADRITGKLIKIAESEKGPVEMNSQVVIGMMVELLGLEMQMAGQEALKDMD